jgi:hypothetical protein
MNRWERVGAAVVLAVAASALGRRLVEGAFLWLMWADRDLVRSTQWPLPVVGAELSYGAGARVPGGAVHALMGLPLALGAGPTGVYRFMVALDLAAAAWLAWAVWRAAGPGAAAVAVAVVALSPIAADNLATLWNPGFLPLAATAVWLGVVAALRGGRPGWLVGAALALSIGAQLHLSMALLGLGLAAAVAWTPGAARVSGWAMLALVAPYGPYLVAEARSGWPNTALLLAQRQVADAVSTERLALDNAVPLLGFLGGAGGGVSHAAAAIVAVAAAVGLWGLRRERAVAGALVAVGVVLAYHLVDANIQLGLEGTGRYLQVMLPGLAGLVAVGVAAAARERPWLWGVVGAGFLVLGAAWHEAHTRRARHPLEFGRLAAAVEGLAAERGSAAEVLGRTVLLTRSRDGWRWSADDALEWFLDGEPFPGSLPGPCVALVVGDADPAEAVATLGATAVRALEQRDGLTVVTYDRDGLCPTSLADRYLLSPQEAQLAEAYEALPADVGVELGPNATAVALDALRRAEGPAAVRVALLLERDGRRLVLHSNQLRGLAHNAGFYQAARAERLELVLRGDREHRVRLGGGPVGLGGVATPLRAELPAGRWSVTLEASLARGAATVDVAAPLGEWEVE